MFVVFEVCFKGKKKLEGVKKRLVIQLRLFGLK